MTEAFPLHWPDGWPRTEPHRRKRSPFSVTPDAARKSMLLEVRRLGGKSPVISTDMPLRNDGMPYAGRRPPDDPGAALYFERKGIQQVLACDQYEHLHDNMRALAKTIEAMRGIERWGSTDILDRAFTSFQALPAPEQWWQVLGLDRNASLDDIDAAYRRLAKAAYADGGGGDVAMVRLNLARDAGRQARS